MKGNLKIIALALAAIAVDKTLGLSTKVLSMVGVTAK